MAYSNFKSLFDASLRELNGLIDDFDDCDFYQKRSAVKYDIKPLRLWRDSLRCALRKVWPYMNSKERKNFKDQWKKTLTLGKIIKRVRTKDGYVNKIDSLIYNRYRLSFSEITKLLRFYASKKEMLIRNKRGNNWEEPSEW